MTDFGKLFWVEEDEDDFEFFIEELAKRNCAQHVTRFVNFSNAVDAVNESISIKRLPYLVVVDPPMHGDLDEMVSDLFNFEAVIANYSPLVVITDHFGNYLQQRLPQLQVFSKPYTIEDLNDIMSEILSCGLKTP